nr:hypothetical protein [Cryptosporangium aurantiacum]
MAADAERGGPDPNPQRFQAAPARQLYLGFPHLTDLPNLSTEGAKYRMSDPTVPDNP